MTRSQAWCTTTESCTYSAVSHLVGVILASAIPAASIFTLYFVQRPIDRLVVLLAYSALFSVCLALFTSARRVGQFLYPLATCDMSQISQDPNHNLYCSKRTCSDQNTEIFGATAAFASVGRLCSWAAHLVRELQVDCPGTLSEMSNMASSAPATAEIEQSSSHSRIPTPPVVIKREKGGLGIGLWCRPPPAPGGGGTSLLIMTLAACPSVQHLLANHNTARLLRSSIKVAYSPCHWGSPTASGHTRNSSQGLYSWEHDGRQYCT